MINAGAMVQYAASRTKNHLLRFRELARQIEAGVIEEDWLARLETQDNIFPQLQAASEFLEGAPVTVTAPPVPRAPVKRTERLRIAMICPEILPFAKTGGLADMVGSLAKALDLLGHQVALVMPAYRQVLRNAEAVPESITDTGIRFDVPVAHGEESAAVLKAELGSGIPVYFIRADGYFDRDYLYGAPGADYPDNSERFAFFSRESGRAS